MYIVTNSKVTKLTDTLTEANLMAKQLSSVFNSNFKVTEHKDVWSVNNGR